MVLNFNLSMKILSEKNIHRARKCFLKICFYNKIMSNQQNYYSIKHIANKQKKNKSSFK